MFKVLELSVLFVCLGGFVKVLSSWGTEEIAGLWIAWGISAQADFMNNAQNLKVVTKVM